MADRLLHGGRRELEVLFDELADELRSVGASLDILMVGGSWLLWFGERQATRDVDSASRISAEAAQAVARVAERHDIDADWVNAKAAAFLPHDFDPRSCTTIFERDLLTVRTPPPETIFLMKLNRAGLQDREDMVLLWKRCAFSDPAEVVERYAAAYPHAPDDPHLDDYVEAIAADATT
jgi:hypothetical protein